LRAVPIARYDGQTGWYESFASGEGFVHARRVAAELLGSGPGRCLDLGCGTGLAIPFLAERGWTVVGVDTSGDQLEVARRERGHLAESLLAADAHALPFGDAEFDGAVSILTHTDFDDVGGVLREVRRVLRPGAPFVYVGVHPCFGSPFVEWRDFEFPRIVPGYRQAGWQVLPDTEENRERVRARVGINHITLADLLNAVIESGLTIRAVQEPGDRDPPLLIAVVAELV
jgi:SAM-dependent methyltransferase